MESTDRELILKVGDSNDMLRGLYEEHLELDNMIARLENMPFQTAQEQLQIKSLKRKKLMGMDRMMDLIAPYRIEN